MINLSRLMTLPNHNEVRYVLLYKFSIEKTLTRNEAYDLLSSTFNLTDHELLKKTKGKNHRSFYSTIDWQFTVLSNMGFIKLGGHRAKITKTGMNVATLLKKQDKK